MKNPNTSYADLISFLERLSDVWLVEELTPEEAAKMTLPSEQNLHDGWISEARRLTGRKPER